MKSLISKLKCFFHGHEPESNQYRDWIYYSCKKCGNLLGDAQMGTCGAEYLSKVYGSGRVNKELEK